MNPKVLKLLFTLIPAIVAGVQELAEALDKDSDGGKKVTPDEADKIWVALKRKLKPIVMDTLLAD